MRPTFIILAAALTVAGLTACEGSEPVSVQPNAATGSASAKDTEVKLSAKKTTYQPGPLDDGQPRSCVRVTVTNQRDRNLEVNPLYFSIVDIKGEKHEIGIGMTEDQIDTTSLAPGEKASGVVCGDGEFTPKIVAMTDELLQEQARAEVG